MPAKEVTLSEFNLLNSLLFASFFEKSGVVEMIEENDEDIYDEDGVYEFMYEDMIDEAEAGFMEGYLAA